jgi:hypothetical protein
MDHETQQLSRELADWRLAHSAPERIPERIWSQAVMLALKHGVSPTSRALKLSYATLKRKVEDSTACLEHASADFFEIFPAAPVAAQLVECVVEVQARNGSRLRVEAKNFPVSELAALARSFMEV